MKGLLRSRRQSCAGQSGEAVKYPEVVLCCDRRGKMPPVNKPLRVREVRAVMLFRIEGRGEVLRTKA